MLHSRLWREFWKSFKPRPKEGNKCPVARVPFVWKALWNEVTSLQILYFLPILKKVKITLENI